MLLLIDAGNSYIKFASHADNNMQLLAACASDIPADKFAYHLRDLKLAQIHQISFTSTLSTQRNQELMHLLQSCWSKASLHIIHTHADVKLLQHCYTKVQNLGTDRWLAMLGVINQHKTPALIIDAGTVLTIDAINNKQHLGGWMIPGEEKMLASLNAASGIAQGSQSATGMTNNSPGITSIIFGQDTAAGVHNGIQAALLGSIEHAIALTSQHFGTTFTVYITGGNADKFVNMLSMPVTHVPNLVFDGLLYVTQNHQSLFVPQTVTTILQDTV